MEQLNAKSAVERGAGFFKLSHEIDTVTVWSDFLHNDDSTVVLNVKDNARVGQKTASASVHRYPASDSIDNALL